MLKNKKLTQKELCDKWLINKTINPETSRKIKENGEVYKKLEKLCSLNQKLKKDVKITQKELCDKWLVNKTINPETSRKIKENGEVYKKLEKLCSVKTASLKSSSFKTAVSEFSDEKRLKLLRKYINYLYLILNVYQQILLIELIILILWKNIYYL
jgi:hypothetical protein